MTTMFARTAVRTARNAAPPLKQRIRAYATEAPPKSSGSSAALYGAIGATALAGGYWYTTQAGAPVKADAPAKKAFTGDFVSLKLAEVEPLSKNTKRFRFELPEPDMVSGLPVASAVVTKYKGPQDEKPTIRPYTPTSDEDLPGYVDFVIKAYPNGPMSQHIHAMAPGQRLDIKGPIPKYPIEENKHKEIAMIAGGTGITPMFQVMRAIFKNPNDKTKVTVVYGNVEQDDILLRKELQELENTYPQRFRAFYTLDKPPADWPQGKGFISKDVLKTVLPEPKSDNIKIFVCGPPGLYKAISGTKNSPSDQGELDGALKELGYSKDQVFKF